MDDCVCSGANCTACDSNGCTFCEDGYTKGSNAKCYNCDDAACANCSSSADVCSSCNPEFALVGGNCVACSAGCSECSANDVCSVCGAGYVIGDGFGC